MQAEILRPYLQQTLFLIVLKQSEMHGASVINRTFNRKDLSFWRWRQSMYSENDAKSSGSLLLLIFYNIFIDFVSQKTKKEKDVSGCN